MHADLPSFVAHPNPEIYLSDNYLTLDFETSNHEHGSALDKRNSLILACWRVGKDHRDYRGRGNRDYVRWNDEFGQSDLLSACESADVLIAHNIKFEYGWLKRCGVDLRKVLGFCTMIGEKVLAGNRKVGLSLQDTATRRGLGGKEEAASALIKAGVPVEDIPREMLEAYCAKDVALSEAIFLEQREELRNLGLLPVAYCRNLVTPALADIEFNGMTLDSERVSAAFEDYSERYGKLQESFAALTGGINVKSPKQMREFIYGVPDAVPPYDITMAPKCLGFKEVEDFRGKVLKTESGESMTDKHTLAKLKAETPEQKAFLKVANELVKLKTPLQNLTKMRTICLENPDDPRMFFTFNQTLTDTDRLSSTARRGGLQGQNIDRNFKRIFRARERGSKLCESDGIQLEFRVACHLGRDKQGLNDILGGLDVHQVSADYHGCDRQEAKARTFRPLFGGKSGTPRERRYIAYFNARYNGVFSTQTRWTMDAARNKYIVTETGSRFYFPDTEIQKSGYVTNTTKIFNGPIQQIATGDIIPLCLVLVWHRSALFGDDCTIRNTVHDSIISEVTDSIVEIYKDLVKWAFTDGVKEMLVRLYGINFTMPLGVGIKVAEHWSDTKIEEKYEPLDSKSLD